MFQRHTKVIFKIFLISLLPLVSFQNCGGDVDFKKKKTPIGPHYGNGSGHEGKPTIPIDYVKEITDSTHYQESINFSSSPSSNSGHLEDVVYYCRSIDSESTRGVDLVITKPVNEFKAAEENTDFTSLPNSSSFVRASVATAWNANGIMQIYAANIPRLGVVDSRSSIGFLMEPQTTNELLHSQDFLASSWTPVRVDVATTIANDSPTQNSQAFILSEGTHTNFHYIEQSMNLSPSTAYNFSVYGKEMSPGRGFSVRFYDIDGRNFRCSYSFSDKSISRSNGSKPFDCKATKYPSGWVRLEVSTQTEAAPSPSPSRVKIELYKPGIGGDFTGTNHPGVLLWGAQLEASNGLATSYIPTTTSTATRAADQLTLRQSLLELDNAKLELKYKLPQKDSRVELGLMQSSTAEVLTTMTQNLVTLNAGNGLISKSFSETHYDNRLSLKLVRDEFSLYSQGQFVGKSELTQALIGSIVLRPSIGPVLIESLGLSYSSPINEVLSLSSQASPIHGLHHAVLVLGRKTRTGAHERLQTQAVPLETDSDLTAWSGLSNNISIWPVRGQANVYQVAGKLSDGSLIDSLSECRKPN